MTSVGVPVGAAAISRYRFVRHLATGGMAEVYAAEASGVAGTVRPVAIKRVIRDHLGDPGIRTMFAREARLCVRLQHPNIVQTYDVLDADGELNIIMELLDGLSLQDLLRTRHTDGPALDIAQAVYVVDRVLAGLHHAHELLDPTGAPLGIVHRDVSPQNIFLTRDGCVKLLDFGVAKATASQEDTESGVVKGKVLFMAPEQCQGAAVDRRADIFSVGLLLYTLLTEVHPFRGRNPYDTMRAVIHDPLPHPHDHRPGLPSGLVDVLTRALEKHPADRYPSAADMRAHLVDVARDGQLYCTDAELAHQLASHLGPREPSPPTGPLPPDLMVGAVPETPPRPPSSEDATLAETEHALVERVGGLTVVQLRGTLDESFDTAPLVPHLLGRVLIDTAHVTRITSYGIRGLLQLHQTDQEVSLHHLRCSVPFLQQVSMVRSLLGGGSILSFHLPYVDPVNGNPFTVLLEGTDAAAALQDRQAPPRTCPGFPDRQAHFDEDAESYFWFAELFQACPPPELRPVLDRLAADHRRREVEKGIDQDGTRIWIRRPLVASFRWRNLLGGVEGRVHLDLEHTPSWTREGVQALMQVLGRESDGIVALRVTHAPRPLVEELFEPSWQDRLGPSTGRVHARCEDCATPRRVAIELARLPEVQAGVAVPERCPACGGALHATEGFEDLPRLPGTLPTAPEQVEQPTSRPPAIVGAILALGILVALVGTWWIATSP